MNRQRLVLFCGGMMAALVLSLCAGAPAQQSSGSQKAVRNQPAATSAAALDRMIAAGKSQRELAQHFFDTHGCTECHTIGSEGRLGFTAKGRERATRLAIMNEGDIGGFGSPLESLAAVLGHHASTSGHISARIRSRSFGFIDTQAP